MWLLANWKMNLNAVEAAYYLEELVNHLGYYNLVSLKLGVAPSFTELMLAADRLRETNVWIGAQDVSGVAFGAFTGEVSARQLQAVGVKFVLIGHSERRQRWPETDEQMASKVKQALNADLLPIFCVGEQLDERDRIQSVLVEQLKPFLISIKESNPEYVVIAYEPVWAIGTGLTPSSKDIENAHHFIRQVAESVFKGQIWVLYGGSVNRTNAATLIQIPGVSGLLVGGASLEVSHLIDILKACIATID
jgi:triosephosphate isomerase